MSYFYISILYNQAPKLYGKTNYVKLVLLTWGVHDKALSTSKIEKKRNRREITSKLILILRFNYVI